MSPRCRRVVQAVAIAFLFACGGSPWDVSGAPDVPPDEQFRTGVEVGIDAYVWHCHRGSRVLVTQAGSACLGTSKPRIERGACGAPLPQEADLDPHARDAGAEGLPPAQRWPGSPGATLKK